MASAADILKREAPRETPLKTVQLDGQVVMKIVQHCNKALPQLVTGQLLGLDVGQTLEVTDCFPFPTSVAEEQEGDDSGANYQLDMMRCLREVNVDNNTVGWYQSTVMGAYQTVELIETFVNYHETIKKCVCLVYDPQRSARGQLTLRAIRLKDSFIDNFKEGKLTGKELREAGVQWRDVFQELPVKVHNSSLAQALIADLDPHVGATAADLDRLSLSVAPFEAKALEALVECVDDLFAEQTKVSHYHRAVARQQQQMAAWLQKRKQENAARRAAGEEPLPEEDPTQFRPIVEPPALDQYLVSNQIANYCDQISNASSQAMAKMYVMQGLQQGQVTGQ